MLTVAEHMRDRAVADTLVRTARLVATELVRAGISPDLATARIQREAVMRRQLDEWHVEVAAFARSNPTDFTRQCRVRLEEFMFRRGTFAPLTTRYPGEMQLIAGWR